MWKKILWEYDKDIPSNLTAEEIHHKIRYRLSKNWPESWRGQL